MIRNPHTLEDSWWDGPKRFQYINRNVASSIQTEDMFKYLKLFAPDGIMIDIGGSYLSNGKPSSWSAETKPYILKLNILSDNCDIKNTRAEILPFQNESVSLIVSAHTVEHIKGDLSATFKEWVRVLKFGGLIGIVMPNKKHFLHNTEVVEDGKKAYHELEPDELLKLFSELPVEILLFNSRQNNFDFEIIVRKIKV